MFKPLYWQNDWLSTTHNCIEVKVSSLYHCRNSIYSISTAMKSYQMLSHSFALFKIFVCFTIYFFFCFGIAPSPSACTQGHLNARYTNTHTTTTENPPNAKCSLNRGKHYAVCIPFFFVFRSSTRCAFNSVQWFKWGGDKAEWLIWVKDQIKLRFKL